MIIIQEQIQNQKLTLPSLYKKHGRNHTSGKVINPKEIIQTEIATKINYNINC